MNTNQSAEKSPFSGPSLEIGLKKISHYLKDAHLSSFETKKNALREFVTGFITELNKGAKVEINHSLMDEIIATEDLTMLFHVQRKSREIERSIKNIVECYIITLHILTPIEVLNEELFSSKIYPSHFPFQYRKSNPNFIYTRSVNSPFLYESPTINLSLRKFLHHWKQDSTLDFVDGIRTLIKGFLVEVKKLAEIEEDDQLLDEILIVTEFTNLQNQYSDWKTESFEHGHLMNFAIEDIVQCYIQVLSPEKQIVVSDESRFYAMGQQVLETRIVKLKDSCKNYKNGCLNNRKIAKLPGGFPFCLISLNFFKITSCLEIDTYDSSDKEKYQSEISTGNVETDDNDHNNKELADRVESFLARQSKLLLLYDSDSTVSDDCTVPPQCHQPLENQKQKKKISQPETKNERSASGNMIYFMGGFVGSFMGGIAIGIAIAFVLLSKKNYF
jgi:hypothetical protein